MKKLPKLLLAILLVLSLSLSICACDVIDNILGKDCESHVDTDKDGKCDECEAPVETQPECTHSDKDDDGKCDECTADFTDGCDNHVDANDDGKCDVAGCNAAFTDGCDNHVDANDDGVCDVAGCNAAFTDGCDNHVDANDDGVCDVTGCNEAYTDGCDNHVDANLDHVCDSNGCSVVIGTCADANLDHDCDYGCSKVWGDHADADLDHDCDYGCSVAIGDHADADLDHNCDYGCNVAIGDHADADLDHDCDYGCSVAIGVHADADLDHDCDYGCSVAFGTCEDADKDHACDYGCDATFGTEEDKDDDRKCDYCGEAFEDGCDTKDCLDTDNDGLCDNDGCDKATENKPAPGSSIGAAITVVPSEYVTGDITAVDQKIYFKLDATVTGSYGITFYGYANLEIFDSDDLSTAVNSFTHSYGWIGTSVNLTKDNTYYFIATVTATTAQLAELKIVVPEATEEPEDPEVPEEPATGESFESAITLTEGVKASSSVSTDEFIYYKLTASKSGAYTFTFVGFCDVKVYADSALTEALYNLTAPYGTIDTTVELEEGRVYYFVATTTFYNYTAEFDITVSAPTATEPDVPECTEHVDAKNNETDAEGADGKCDICGADVATEEPEEPELPDFDNATELTEGTTVFETITKLNQKFFYKLTTSKSGLYNIKCLYGYYIKVEVYSETNLENAIATWDTGFMGVDEDLEFIEGDTYYIVLTSYQYDYGYPELTVTAPVTEEPEIPECTEHVDAKNNETDAEGADGKCDICGEDMPTVEPEEPAAGSSFETAIELEEGIEVTVPDYVDYNQKFFYEFSASGSYDIIFEGYYFGVELYSEDSLTTAISSWTTPNGSLDETVELTEGKVYYIVLTSQYGYGFSLTVSASSDEPVVAAPGASLETAIELEDGVEVSIASSTIGQKFYYKLTASATGSYSVLTDGFNFTFDVYSANDTTTAIKHWVYYSGATTTMVDLEADKTYYIVLTSDYGYYIDMTVSKPSDEPVVADPGASLETAIELEEGAKVSIASSTIGQKFYYKLTASATGSYSTAINGYFFTVEAFTESDTANAMKTIDVVVDPVTENLELEAGNVYYFVLTSNYGYNIDFTVSAPAAE